MRSILLPLTTRGGDSDARNPPIVFFVLFFAGVFLPELSSGAGKVLNTYISLGFPIKMGRR